MTKNKIITDTGLIAFNILDFHYRSKVAAFDYDHTLVKPNKGTFSLNLDDWQWLRSNVVDVLKTLYEDGYCLVVFTNQSKNFKVDQIKLVLSTLNIPIRVYIGVSEEYKKPQTKMWECFKSSNTSLSFEETLYCGDALGRVGDWSDSDKVFADSCNISIKTPEEVFPFVSKNTMDFIPSGNQELILMMGYQGSGKTTYVNTKIPDSYCKLHGDDLKTDSKKKKAVKKALEEGRSTVLDATHANKDKRKVFIDIAKHSNIPVRLVHITTDFDESKSRNEKRDVKVPIIALYMYRKKYEKPTLEEGYLEIINV
jgi:bifunctional polynucleotide phosphatase/kinase|tara:strand:+ start:1175 stop:2107 length:933 start_codon:yes stop_codon:yes gene_type:complete